MDYFLFDFSGVQFHYTMSHFFLFFFGNDNIVFLHVVNTVKKEHLKELRTGASNSKATRLRELFGKTFSPEKVFVLPRFTKSANLSSNFFQL